MPDADVIDLADYRPGWIVAMSECDVCGRVCQFTVCHIDSDLEHLECPDCACFTLRVTAVYIRFE